MEAKRWSGDTPEAHKRSSTSSRSLSLFSPSQEALKHNRWIDIKTNKCLAIAQASNEVEGLSRGRKRGMPNRQP